MTMMDKQYSVEFFTSLVESMQKVCREYLHFEQAVELSGYLSLEIDSTQRERYVVSELLHSTGSTISESYCTKAFKTVPHHTRKTIHERQATHRLNGRQQDQSAVLNVAADSGGYSRQFTDRDLSSDFSVVDHNHARGNDSFSQADVSEQEQMYLTGGWESAGVQLEGGSAEAARQAGVSPRSPSATTDRLTGTAVKRHRLHAASTSEPKKGKPSANIEHSEHSSPSPVSSNIPQTSDQLTSTYPPTTDSLSSGPSLSDIKTEVDDSLQFVQIDNAEDSSGVDSVDQFRTMPTGNLKSVIENVQYTQQGNHQLSSEGLQGVWQGDAQHQVELFKGHEETSVQENEDFEAESSDSSTPLPCAAACSTARESDRVQCHVCSLFLCSTSLRSHIRRHKGEFNISCPECHKQFFSREFLNEHIAKSHRKTKLCECKICGKSLTTYRGMRYHVKRHSQERHKESSKNAGQNGSKMNVHKKKYIRKYKNKLWEDIV